MCPANRVGRPALPLPSGPSPVCEPAPAHTLTRTRTHSLAQRAGTALGEVIPLAPQLPGGGIPSPELSRKLRTLPRSAQRLPRDTFSHTPTHPCRGARPWSLTPRVLGQRPARLGLPSCFLHPAVSGNQGCLQALLCSFLLTEQLDKKPFSWTWAQPQSALEPSPLGPSGIQCPLCGNQTCKPRTGARSCCAEVHCCSPAGDSDLCSEASGRPQPLCCQHRGATKRRPVGREPAWELGGRHKEASPLPLPGSFLHCSHQAGACFPGPRAFFFILG